MTATDFRIESGPRLPEPRGPFSALVLDHIRQPVHAIPAFSTTSVDGAMGDDDLQLALYTCYELHYRGFSGIDEAWEWEPSLLALRAELESQFELELLSAAGPVRPPGDVPAQLHDIISSGSSAPSLSGYVETQATRREVEELAIHRSAYQLKEADPHTWGIPRLSGRPKAAMVDIQTDEYGNGHEADMHSSLFARTMVELGLDATYGAYIDRLPGTTLATVNLISLFGLHRRWRGALVGHLALFEMTSCGPMARYSRALDRLGFGLAARRFYDVHVEADIRHAVVAASDLAGGLASAEPDLAGDILFGAQALMAIEAAFSSRVLKSWRAGRSSLLPCQPHQI